jgi:hypothetical protein
VLLAHAVGTPEIAPGGYGYAGVADGTPEPVDERGIADVLAAQGYELKYGGIL